MGLKLDWDIESEQGKHQEHSEDPQERLTRYRGVFKFFAAIAVFIAIVGGVVFLVFQRLEQVESRLERLLVDTVKSEVASLRIGDFDTFMDIQWSGSDDWRMSQEQIFQNYQQLKVANDVSLSGQVTAVEIDGQRGRVKVEEIINGVPYQRLWFYFRLPDEVNEEGEITDVGGWHHVPQDNTFWGEPRTLQRDRFTVAHRTVDEPVAEDAAVTVAGWLEQGCMWFACDSLPTFTLRIVSESLPEATWEAPTDTEPARLTIASPFLQRARIDMPFNPELRMQTATRLAEQLVSATLTVPDVTYPSDAYYIRSAVTSWLVGWFVGVDTSADLIESLAANYGTETVGQLVRALQPSSNIAILSAVTGVVPLSDINVNWRDFVEYRLNTEAELIRRRDEANWRQLYDLRSETVLNTAYERYAANMPPEEYRVRSTDLATAPDGTPQLRASVQITRLDGTTADTVVAFNLVDNVWRRAN